MKKKADVSILSANFNNGQYIKDFFESIKNSTILPKQIVFADDCSTDRSLEIADAYSKDFENLLIIKLEKNLGFANALNEGKKYCTGRFVLRCDPDDMLTADRIASQVEFLITHETIDVLGGNCEYFLNNNPKRRFKSSFPTRHDNILKAFLNGDLGILHGTAMIRKEVFGLYDYAQKWVPAEDYDIFGRMIRDGRKFANVKETMIFQRIHQCSSTNNVKIDLLNKTFELRKDIFGIECSKSQVRKKFLFLSTYRKALFEQNIVKRYWLILQTICFCPQRVTKRLKNTIDNFFNSVHCQK
jgi:glycosyltransferase involved in cell wall biosynthesis